MKKHAKAVFGVAVALLLVIAIGMTLSDHSLKATDGDENIVEEELTADETIDEELTEDEDVSEELTDENSEADADLDSEDEEETDEDAELEETSDTEDSDARGNITITSNIDMNSQVVGGESVTLTANVDGFEGVDYTFQWLRSKDGENWEVVEGASSSKYTFTMTEENSGYMWQVRLVED